MSTDSQPPDIAQWCNEERAHVRAELGDLESEPTQNRIEIDGLKGIISALERLIAKHSG
jgi:hypothetical protein